MWKSQLDLNSKFLVLQKFGSGGWIFGSTHGPFEPPLEDRIRIDQSQGYEPCGLNLGRLLLNGESTPPRYAPEPLMRCFSSFPCPSNAGIFAILFRSESRFVTASAL